MATEAASDPLLMSAAIFLGSALLAVPLFKRLGLGSVLGYLAAGAVIGPYGLGLFRDVDGILHFAEFGVVLLLFIIGLELKPARLWRLRSDIFGLGTLQIVISGAAIAGFCILVGLPTSVAIVAGGALALSSTAFGVQILREKQDLTAPYGDRTFSILLAQDLAIVPLFTLVAFLGPATTMEGNMWTQGGIAIGAVVALYVAIRYLIHPFFRVIAATGSNELFLSAALFLVIGAALLMDVAGLSMALGAFIAGVLLAESEFRHQLETDIEPFRGLLLGLFFMGFGMTLDWSLIIANWWIVIGGAFGLFAAKGIILYALARLFKSPHDDALRISATIGQGGEFAFVMVSLATAAGIMSGTIPAILSAIVTLSMVVTPAALALADWRIARSEAEEDTDGMDGPEASEESRVIIAGFGRVGQIVARLLRMRGIEVTIIDNSPRRIRIAETFGTRIYFGDARRLDILESAGAADADMLFLCINDRSGAVETVEKLRERFPDLRIFANTYDRFSENLMRAAGAEFVIRETFESALVLARRGLNELGHAEVCDDLIDEFRRRDEERLQLETQYGMVKALEMLREKYALDEE
ncbi:monovalent cation:H+ antiporter-2, CPA2 family/glutathione-regulated potassium-efflux system protein KefB [Monaibacterium marinum]|uniref:Monovalent cation:H+ antiporter-2, CPA2 family/glutathione-regulated potassium-efflux system protein KefB n=1 Tax=Pontivivens marinum TaxID=1690039 RepID=A0A2C9CSC0_9RHOB|nr:monovalent cation:proton antiporter-2 (CPA2) family protein [Monaibacterium marinum]SOH94244.1 monovalent cation:H+ antiporter-2, CPA2 family/glutathione-regulated potassium-efflux system protein KefB [Monaibacterium marinum]